MEMCSALNNFRVINPNLPKTTLMAKSKRRISPADVPPGMILVRSRAYGDHLRAKRGTYKEAKLNPAFEKGTVFVIEANAAAKLFQDAVEPYRKGLVDKSLWQNLLSMFRLQQTETGAVDFSQLKPFEFDTRYTLDKLYPAQVVTKYDDKTRTLRAVISYGGPPDFGKSRVDGYKLTAIVLFPDLKKQTARTVVEESAIRSLEGNHPPFDVSVSVPRKAESFILCLRLDGCCTGKVYHTIATKGMAVIAAGALARP